MTCVSYTDDFYSQRNNRRGRSYGNNSAMLDFFYYPDLMVTRAPKYITSGMIKHLPENVVMRKEQKKKNICGGNYYYKSVNLRVSVRAVYNPYITVN